MIDIVLKLEYTEVDVESPEIEGGGGAAPVADRGKSWIEEPAAEDRLV